MSQAIAASFADRVGGSALRHLWTFEEGEGAVPSDDSVVDEVDSLLSALPNELFDNVAARVERLRLTSR